MPQIDGISICREEGHKWPASANVYLFRDAAGGILFDVGCGKEESFENLVAFVGREGLALTDIHTIVLSHAHPDHMGAMRFLQEVISPRVVISAIDRPLAEDPQELNRTFDMGLTRHYFGDAVLDELGMGEFNIIDYFAGLCPMSSAAISDTVADGDILELGGGSYEVLITPGHAPGHVSLWRSVDRVLLSSDLVGEITAWYSPTSGGAAGFLASLDRVCALDARLILPAHGGVIEEVRPAIEHTRRRVLAVEDRVSRILADGPRRVGEICAAMYGDRIIRFFPGIQILDSHLDRMAADGRVVREGEGVEQIVHLQRYQP
jgi:glyoxylase-like metal-dependent hydrolase (beta-lactamase superfamily II)